MRTSEELGRKENDSSRTSVYEAETIHCGQHLDKVPTIVVPIFNACDELKQCIQSLSLQTHSPHHVVLINDGSTDPQIRELLDGLSGRHPHWTIIHHARNAGYTATINEGARWAGNGDVILLNSDTIVTPYWLEKLSACAASKDNVGTVTALSNAAGVFSIPERGINHAIPPHLSVNAMAELVAKLSHYLRPEVPTGNGFCMYISRVALTTCGQFDEQNFPKGYGEENDFCMRTIAQGFVHLIDDATFIYHKRSASFQSMKDPIYSTSYKKLTELHPHYEQAIQRWLADDPLDDFRSEFGAALSDDDPLGPGNSGDKPGRPERWQAADRKLIIDGDDWRLMEDRGSGSLLTCRFSVPDSAGLVLSEWEGGTLFHRICVDHRIDSVRGSGKLPDSILKVASALQIPIRLSDAI